MSETSSRADWCADPLASYGFTWEEVNCFMRPQATMAEWAAQGCGRRFLMLTALYRAWGPAGYFAKTGQWHFDFAREVLPQALNLRIDLTSIETIEDVIGTLDRLLQHAPVLVPCYVHRPQSDGRTGVVHYLLVTVKDGERYRALDNLHLEERDGVPHCGVVWFDQARLEAMTLDYWTRYVAAPGRTHHNEPRYWLMQLGACSGIDASGDQLSRARRLLTDFRQHPDESERRKCRDYFVDARHLAGLRALSETGAAVPQWQLRSYLAEVNECNLQLRLLLDALAVLSPDLAPGARALISAGSEAAAAVRTGLLVAVLSQGQAGSPHWDQAIDELWGLANNLRNDLLRLTEQACSGAYD